MASKQTTNYGLNQWAAEDRIIREEFNSDNLKVDNALSALSTEVGTKATQTALSNLSTSMNTLSTTLNSTISTGLAKKYGTDFSYIKSGSYTGTGATTITITTGFKPSLVMIFNLGASGSGNYSFMVGNASAQILFTIDYGNETGNDFLSVSSNGFTAKYQPYASTVGLNAEGYSYHYIAFR